MPLPPETPSLPEANHKLLSLPNSHKLPSHPNNRLNLLSDPNSSSRLLSLLSSNKLPFRVSSKFSGHSNKLSSLDL